MASRTTETAVREIMDTQLGDRQIRAFILDASLWVTEEIVPAEPVQSAERLEIIERYLSCALIRLRELGLKQGTVENVSEQYQVDPEVTDYLLRAASFDASGKVRSQFLSATSAGGSGDIVIPKPIVFGVGTGFKEEAETSESDE